MELWRRYVTSSCRNGLRLHRCRAPGVPPVHRCRVSAPWYRIAPARGTVSWWNVPTSSDGGSDDRRVDQAPRTVARGAGGLGAPFPAAGMPLDTRTVTHCCVMHTISETLSTDARRPPRASTVDSEGLLACAPGLVPRLCPLAGCRRCWPSVWPSGWPSGGPRGLVMGLLGRGRAPVRQRLQPLLSSSSSRSSHRRCRCAPSSAASHCDRTDPPPPGSLSVARRGSACWG
jgi:hypothetical protein